MVKNVEKFENSIALIVTKVDNIFNKSGELLSDETILCKILNFMLNVKTDLESKIQTNDKPFKNYYPEAINLIDIFLRKGLYKYC